MEPRFKSVSGKKKYSCKKNWMLICFSLNELFEKKIYILSQVSKFMKETPLSGL